MKTYRGVDGLIALEVGILAETVMSLAEGDAGNAPGDQAEIDGLEAAEEGAVPRLGVLGRLGVENITGLGEDLVDADLPVLDIAVIDGAGVVLVRGRHV